MKNVIILEQNRKVYFLSNGDGYIHSAWANKEKAEQMLSILNIEEYSGLVIREIRIDDEIVEKIGFEVLVDICTGEQAANEFVGMDHNCVYIDGEEDNGPYAYSFIYDRYSAYPGQTPRRIDGTWYVNTIDNSHIEWHEFLTLPDYKEKLEPCLVSCKAATKEEALRLAKEFSVQVLADLESREDWKISEAKND